MTPLEQAMLSQRPWFDRRTAEQIQAPSPMTNEELISAIRNFDRPQAELRSFDPLASDMRQNMLAEALGASRAQRIDEGLAWVDPVSPLIDTMQRQQRGEDITPLDYMIPVAGLAAPTAGKVGARFLDDLARVVPSRAPGWVPLPAQEMVQGLDAATFIGPSARTWDKASAEEAARLLEEGVSPDDVWRQTGTWRGPDGMFRQEISDEAARWVGPLAISGTPRVARADQVLDHPELFRAYPDLKEMQVTSQWTPTRGRAQYAKYDDGSEQIKVGAALPEGATSSLLHEMQHGIQGREGFAVGASPNTPLVRQMAADAYRAQFADKLRAAEAELTAARAMRSRVKDWTEGAMRLDARIGAAQREASKLRSEMARIEDESFASEKAQDVYRRVAGEVEARDVEARMRMTAAERRNQIPGASQGVPRENQIVIKPEGRRLKWTR